jgi:hypothetical protein
MTNLYESGGCLQMDNEVDVEGSLPEAGIDCLRVISRGYAEGVSIAECEFEGDVQPCVEFHAECGHTGSIVPLVDIVKHALRLYPATVVQASRELGVSVPEAIESNASD